MSSRVVLVQLGALVVGLMAAACAGEENAQKLDRTRNTTGGVSATGGNAGAAASPSGGVPSDTGGASGSGGSPSTGGSGTGGAETGGTGGTATGGGTSACVDLTGHAFLTGFEVTPNASKPTDPTPLKSTPNPPWLGGAYDYTDNSVTIAENAWLLGMPGHDSAQALELSFDTSNWGGGMGLWMQGCYDMSAFAGIQFWAKDPDSHKGTVAISTRASTVPANGGTCTLSACDPFKAPDIQFSPDWTLYQVPFATLKSPSFVDPLAGKDVLGFNLNVGTNKWGSTDHIEFWIDDIGLYGTAPSNGGAGGGGGMSAGGASGASSGGTSSGGTGGASGGTAGTGG